MSSASCDCKPGPNERQYVHLAFFAFGNDGDEKLKNGSNPLVIAVMPKKTMKVDTKVIPDESLFGAEDATPKAAAAAPKRKDSDKASTPKAAKAAVDSDSDSDDEPAKPAVKKVPTPKASSQKASSQKAGKSNAKSAAADSDDEDEEETKPTAKASSKAGKSKAKSAAADSDDEDEEETKPTAKAAKSKDSDSESSTSSKKSRKKAVPTDAVMKFVEDLLRNNTDGHGSINVKAISTLLHSDETKQELTEVLQKATPASRQKKDPDAPKRPRNAYLYFCQDHREELKKEHPSLKGPDITAKLAEMWGALSPKKKKKYEEMNEQDKQRYESEMKEYDPDSFKPKKPKKAKTAFLCFSVDMRNEVKAKHPKLPAKEITAELGRMWREDYADENEVKQNKLRAKWIKMAEEDAARYKAEMDQWMIDHPEEAEELRKKEEAKKSKGKAKKTKSTEDDEDEEKTKSAASDDDEDEDEEKEKKMSKSKKTKEPAESNTGMVKFMTERRAELTKAQPNLSPAQIAAKLKAEWEKMSKDERAEWEEDDDDE